jgi:regulator of ribonuclease activity A
MLSTPDLSDLNPDAQALPFQFQRFGRKVSCQGPIATVACFEDNSRVKEAVLEPGNGRVLLVDGSGSLRRALTGDLVAASAMENGWAGMVIIGAIRDAEVIDTFDFAVFALGTSPIKTEKLGRGERDVALEFDGVDFSVEPGQFLAADVNGVLINKTPFLTG